MVAYHSATSLHTIPIAERPAPSLLMRAHKLAFLISFVGSLIIIHLFQLVGLPLVLFAPVWRSWILHSKVAFSSLLLAISQLFAPCSLRLTAGEGVELETMCKRDVRTGETVGFELDQYSGALACASRW